jgi:hypothetical protein
MQILAEGYQFGKYHVILVVTAAIIFLSGTKLLDVRSGWHAHRLPRVSEPTGGFAAKPARNPVRARL